MAECKITSEKNEDILVLKLEGNIDSSNSADCEQEIFEIRNGNKEGKLQIDAEKLAYISSNGLRILLKLQKSEKEKILVKNVSPEVFEVLSMTGFTEILEVKKALRSISIEGCAILGQGGNGTVYRLDNETIVKVYREGTTLAQIEQEQNFAKNAFVAGLPTAIAFDVVKCGESYGVVFELFDSCTFSKAIIDHPEKFDEYMDKYVELVRKLSETHVDVQKFTSIKTVLLERLEMLGKYIPKEEIEVCKELVSSMRECDTLIHGDLHPGNIMLQNGELMLIDMADITVGPPIYDIVCLYRDLCSAPNASPMAREVVEHSIGMKSELILKVWDAFIKRYLKTDDSAKIEEFLNPVKMMYCLNMVCMLIMGGEQIVLKAKDRISNNIIKGVLIPNKDTLKHLLETM